MSPAVRVAVLIVGVLLVVWLLFTVVFPWVDRTFVSDPVLGLAGVALAGGRGRAGSTPRGHALQEGGAPA